jgi:hypothetical protein
MVYGNLAGVFDEQLVLSAKFGEQSQKTTCSSGDERLVPEKWRKENAQNWML